MIIICWKKLLDAPYIHTYIHTYGLVCTHLYICISAHVLVCVYILIWTIKWHAIRFLWFQIIFAKCYAGVKDYGVQQKRLWSTNLRNYSPSKSTLCRWQMLRHTTYNIHAGNKLPPRSPRCRLPRFHLLSPPPTVPPPSSSSWWEQRASGAGTFQPSRCCYDPRRYSTLAPEVRV